VNTVSDTVSAPGNIFFDQLLLDAGYDSEANHTRLREGLGIESVIPAKAGRPTDKLPSGKWRWLMATNFNTEDYGQRWQVESVMRMIKARQGESLTARSDGARRDELGLMTVTHNVMILIRTQIRAFLQSTPDPFSDLNRLPTPFPTLGKGWRVARSDSKGFVAVNKNNTQRFRMDIEGHGDNPHGHLQVYDSKSGRWIDATDDHRLYFYDTPKGNSGG